MSATTATTATTVILDQGLVAEIRRIEQASGRNGIFATCVQKLEQNLGEFRDAIATCVARGDTLGAVRAAHTLKGSCRQLAHRRSAISSPASSAA